MKQSGSIWVNPVWRERNRCRTVNLRTEISPALRQPRSNPGTTINYRALNKLLPMPAPLSKAAVHPARQPASAHVARKRFGQHFLTDASVIDAIVSAIAPQPDDQMVEIGPGLGALTGPVLAALKHLHAVEIDRDVIARLGRTFPPARLTIHPGDALVFDFGALAAAMASGHKPQTLGGSAPAHDAKKLRVIGNLPYNISTPLLFHLATFADRILDCHFMLQKEVVARMAAAPGTKDYGRLSVALQYRFEIEPVLDVPPEAFEPPPKVDSAVVRMIPRPAAQMTAQNEAGFAALVTQAFSQRRKTLRNTLKGRVSDAQFAAAGIDPGARAEEIEVARFVALANLLGAP